MNWYKIAQIELDFENLHLDYHNGQNVFRLLAKNKETQEPVGGIDYSGFEEEIYIDHILVKQEYRRIGIGTQLINKLKELNSGMKINWGMSTPEGFGLQQSIKAKNELV